MAIVNATPDSFFSGSRIDTLHHIENSLKYVKQCISDGAHVIDIGGESTRPGAEPVSLQEELQRVCPLLEALSSLTTIPISIDTMKPEVAYEAIRRGATIINDVTGLSNPKMRQCLKDNPHVAVVIMHMQGEPKTMQVNPCYPNGVVNEVYDFFKQRIRELASEGISTDRIIIDPGVGFGKTLQQNIELMRSVSRFKELGCPVLYGVSRKAWIGALLDRPIDERLPATLAAGALLLEQEVDYLRVHDVRAHTDLLQVVKAFKELPA